MGPDGLKQAVRSLFLRQIVTACLGGAYDVLYRGAGDFVAHEVIIDIRPFKQAGIVRRCCQAALTMGFMPPP